MKREPVFLGKTYHSKKGRGSVLKGEIFGLEVPWKRTTDANQEESSQTFTTESSSFEGLEGEKEGRWGPGARLMLVSVIFSSTSGNLSLWFKYTIQFWGSIIES